MNKPKILVLDIETSPIISYHWGLYDQNINPSEIIQDWVILSWAAKWYQSPKIFQQDQSTAYNVYDDYKMLKGVWDLLDEADIVLTQNGKSFDIKRLNARFLLKKMKPPSPYRQLDTKLLAKKHFGFTSNSLKYMSERLCNKYKKSDHKEYPGFELWKECIKGNKKAWKEMRKYNIQDVLSLEELYAQMDPWDNSINFSVYEDQEVTACSCGNPLEKKGFSYTNVGKYQRYKCLACGKQHTARINLLSLKKRRSLKK